MLHFRTNHFLPIYSRIVGGNGPDYKYIVDNKRVHKSRYKKSRLKTELTESQATKELGINRIYDCGKIKFECKL